MHEVYTVGNNANKEQVKELMESIVIDYPGAQIVPQTWTCQ